MIFTYIRRSRISHFILAQFRQSLNQTASTVKTINHNIVFLLCQKDLQNDKIQEERRAICFKKDRVTVEFSGGTTHEHQMVIPLKGTITRIAKWITDP